MQKCTVSVPETIKNLLRTTREIRYGELFGVDLDMRGSRETIFVSLAEKDLIRMITDEGIVYIDVLTVHQGDPVIVEMDQELNGFRCRKKVKLPLENINGLS